MTFWLYDKHNETPAIYGSLVAVEQNTTLLIGDLYKHFSIPINKDDINKAKPLLKEAELKLLDAKTTLKYVELNHKSDIGDAKANVKQAQDVVDLNTIKRLYNVSYDDGRYELHKLNIIRAAKDITEKK